MENTQQLLQKIYQSQLGLQAAPTPITGTNAIALTNVGAFQVWTANTTIASITINGTAITAFSGVTLPQGFIVYGNITSITLSAGSGLAYSANNTF
jgi:hypothetical protein